MDDVPSFWQAFEAGTRVVLLIIGWCAPWFIAAGLIFAAIEWRKVVKWWSGQ